MQRIEKQARDIFAEYRYEVLDNKHPKAINTEKFANFVATKMNYNLTMVVIPMGEILRGIIVRNLNISPKKAKIIISDSNNECWSRFTIIKEVCHLFLEHEAKIESDNALIMAQSLMKQVSVMPDFLPSLKEDEKEFSEIDKLLQKLLKDKLGYISENPLDDYLALNNPIGAEEASAVVAAIEIMIPKINQNWIESQIKKGITLYDLATQLKVPKLILEYRLNQWFIPYSK